MRLWAPVLLCCAAIFAGSSIHGSPHPNPTWADWIFRKSAHVGEYAVLFLLTRRALAGGRVPPMFPAAWAFAFCVFYAVTDEFHQTFVRYRDGNARDVLIDAFGAFLASRWTPRTRLVYPRPRPR